MTSMTSSLPVSLLDNDAEALLTALDEAGVPWGGRHQRPGRGSGAKLEQMGLTGRTPCLFVSDTFGRKKSPILPSSWLPLTA